jgi:DNA mismatch repair protein MutL
MPKHGERQLSPTSGTELVIQDLFFNTPARLKFIQSQQSEKTFIRKIIFAFILSRPEIEFQIKIDDADKDIYPARTNHLDRIKDLFPKAHDSILFSQRFYENNELDLYLIPGSFKAPLKLQNIFINDRYITDKQLHRVMSNGLESTFGGDDFHYLAYFNLPPDTIDVNVHPNKTIIKVMEMSKMISLLTSTIRELVGKRPIKEITPVEMPASKSPEMPGLFDNIHGQHTLQQERHEYNMEGLFSPHQLPQSSNEDLIWVGSSFLKKNESMWLAISAPKLLELFTHLKLQVPALTIPLLVSEPFAAKEVKKEILTHLINAGIELEYLGADTIVLRSIPEWMNGFPLQEVMIRLLGGKSFSDIKINPLDWSQSTWNQMLDFFPIDELLSRKIVIDLNAVLKEKFK